MLFGVLFFVLVLVGCSQLGSDGGSSSGGLALENLQAISGTELEATFSNGETKTITEFRPKPLEVGKETEVSFTYEQTQFDPKINYVITIKGLINDNSQKIMSTTDTDSFTADDIAKVVLFYGEDYKMADVENGSFSITIDQNQPGGIAFLSKNDNENYKYIGYLSLSNGLDSIPTQAISDETGEIDLGELTFDENGVAKPTDDPFTDMDDTEKNALAVAGSFMSATLRSPEIIENIVNGDRELKFGLMYFPTGHPLDEDKKGSLSDNNTIESHKISMGFDPGVESYEDIILSYPDNLEVSVDKEEDITQNNIIFPAVGPEAGSNDGIDGPAVPPKGDYEVKNIDGESFKFTLPDIQEEAEDNLVYPVPTVNVDEDGIIQKVEWIYKNKVTNKTLENPQHIINEIEVQIDSDSERLYDSGNLNGETLSHQLNEEIKWSNVDSISLAYNDIYNIHYVIGYDSQNDIIENEKTKVGVVFSIGGLGDRSFNDMTYNGLERAEDDLNISYDYTIPKNTDEIQRDLRDFAEKDYDVVIGVGFQIGEYISEVAIDHSDVKFVSIDYEFDKVPENIATINFDTKEGSFLAGALAANVSNNQNVGFVGGYDIALINEFKSGFKQGVEYINSEIEVQVEYAGSFGNPEKGRELALAMIDNGSDIIYHAAGGTGMGVFEAVKEKDKYAIGVDANQNYLEPGYILASMMKRVDNAVYDMIKRYQEDDFPGGENLFYGLENGGIGLTDLVEIEEETKSAYEDGEITEDDLRAIENMKDEITKIYANEIEDIKNDIINGKIVIE